MNNLLKILISLFFVVSLKADQGMMVNTSFTTPTNSFLNNFTDIATTDTNFYAINSSNAFKYDLDFANGAGFAVGSGNKKILLDTTKLYILESDNLYIRDLNLNPISSFPANSRVFNSMALGPNSLYMYIGCADGVSVIDIVGLQEVAFLETNYVEDLIIKDNTLYIADNWSGVQVVNISNPLLLSLDSTISSLNTIYYKLSIEGNNLYTLSSDGLSMFDISSPSAPTLISTVNTLTAAINSFTDIATKNGYTYIAYGTKLDIFDVGDPSSMLLHTDLSRNTEQVAVLNDSLYLGNSGTIERFDVTSDYPDFLTDGALSVTKTTADLDINNGVFGELDSSGDVDIIEFELPAGRFDTTISGMSDLNVSLYNTTADAQPLISVQSTTNTLELNQEVVAGLRYLRIESMTGETGEYKITALTGGDDWTNIMSSASVINMGETLEGNIIDSEDLDYFRVDVTSKGSLSFTSENGNILAIEVKNSYDDSNLTTTGTLDTTHYVELPSAGTYFIKAYATTVDVIDEDYSFRVDFSKDTALGREDDATFSLANISEGNPLVDNNNIKIVGDTIFVVQGVSTLQEINKDTFVSGVNYAVAETVEDYQIIGDYVYTLATTKLSIFDKVNGVEKSSISAFATAEFLKINGNYAYATEIGTTVSIIDISDKLSMSVENTIDVGSSIYGMDLKTSFIDGVLRTYLYFATNTGLKIYDFTDPQNVTFVQSYKTDIGIMGIKISNPYAYISVDTNYDNKADEFTIIYVKRPTSVPKLKGTINVQGIKDIVVNQDFAYLITNTNDSDAEDKYLKVVDISDQTAPKLIDTTTISGQNSYQYARDIVVEGGLGYIIEKDTTDYKIVKYDMSKDYSDIKNYAKEIDFNTKVYGTISEHRLDDNDTFYINTKITSTLDFLATGDTNTTYELYNFIDDNNISSFEAPLSIETSNSLNIKAGEYYLKVHSQFWASSGAYEFTINKTDDDYTDDFNDATLIDIGKEYSGDILITEDIDIVKIEVTQRGTLTLNTDLNITSGIYYSDAESLIANDVNGVLNLDLNPGTYYIKMESDAGYTGTYTFSTTFVESENFSIADGFDDIGNFESRYVVYGPRYIYSVGVDNQLSIFNHLLQRIQEGNIDTYRDIQNTCGDVQFNNEKIFINIAELDDATGEYLCKYGYEYVGIESDGDTFRASSVNGYNSYYSNYFWAEAGDIALAGTDSNYVYEYSADNSQIYKILLSELDTLNEFFYSKTPQAVLPNTASIDQIKSIKNDANIDFIATNNSLDIYYSDPAYDVYDYGTTPPTYLRTEPTILDSINYNFGLDGDVETMHLDRESKLLYVINKLSTDVKVVNYAGGVSSATISYIDLGLQANGFYVNENAVYISFAPYGVKIYEYPLAQTPVEIHDIPNIGADISAPFSYDGSTFNYLSNGNLQLFLLGDSFKDGTTAGTYSIIDDVKEGEGGVEGCFIATAAYGNYFESHVKVLRDFRDNYLLQNELGRMFVEFYYANSPSIAADISKSEFAKASIRIILTPIVYIIKYPLAFLSILFIFVLVLKARKHMTFKKLLLPLVFISLSFSGCSETSGEANKTEEVPSIRSFVSHIDVDLNATNSVLGNIEVLSAGSSNIEAYIIEGIGESNFNITKNGELSILNYTTPLKYDLQVSARNSYGDSESQAVIVEVTSTNQPVLQDIVVNTDNSIISGSLNLSLILVRDGNGSNVYSNIKDIEIIGENSEAISIDSTDGLISATGINGEALSVGRHEFLVRAVNNSGIIGPYSSLVVNVDDYEYIYYDNSYYDDYPDSLNEAYYVFEVGSGITYSNVYGSMDYDHDHDYIGLYVSQDGNVSMWIETNGIYSYQNSGDYIAIYDSGWNYIGTYVYSTPLMYLTAGQYYINVHETSDFYTLHVDFF